MERSKEIWYHIAAFVIVGIWGTTFISTKVLLSAGLQPAEIFVMRFAVAYCGIWVLAHKKLFCDSWKDELKMVVLGAAGGSMYFWTENTALEYSQACNVSFLVCTTPLLTSLLAIALRKAKMSRALAIGSVIALAGVIMVVFNGQHALKLSPKGDLLAICAALCWAVYSVMMQDILKKYSSAFVTRKVFFYGLVTILPVFLIQPWGVEFSTLLQPKVLGNLLFLAVIASLCCFAAWNPVIRHLGVVKSSNYIYLNPVFTLVAAILILGEKITLLSGIGSVLILLGVIIAGRHKA